MDKKKKLCDCGKMAVYLYMPGYSDGGNPFVCDDCISSLDSIGCSCNWRHIDVNAYHPPLDNPELPKGVEGKDWKWVEHPGNDYWTEIKKEEGIWQYIDERGRPYPCCEYEYEQNGFDEEDFE